jgi:hypothetical protein
MVVVRAALRPRRSGGRPRSAGGAVRPGNEGGIAGGLGRSPGRSGRPAAGALGRGTVRVSQRFRWAREGGRSARGALCPHAGQKAPLDHATTRTCCRTRTPSTTTCARPRSNRAGAPRAGPRPPRAARARNAPRPLALNALVTQRRCGRAESARKTAPRPAPTARIAAFASPYPHGWDRPGGAGGRVSCRTNGVGCGPATAGKTTHPQGGPDGTGGEFHRTRRTARDLEGRAPRSSRAQCEGRSCGQVV